jgi:hypothetical protein
LVQESFLLIFRISHIVTAAHHAVLQQRCITACERRVVENSRVFQHIADYSPRRRRRGGQHLSPAERYSYLRHVVTSLNRIYHGPTERGRDISAQLLMSP